MANRKIVTVLPWRATGSRRIKVTVHRGGSHIKTYTPTHSSLKRLGRAGRKPGASKVVKHKRLLS